MNFVTNFLSHVSTIHYFELHHYDIVLVDGKNGVWSCFVISKTNYMDSLHKMTTKEIVCIIQYYTGYLPDNVKF